MVIERGNGHSPILPDITRGGVLIERPDPQPEVRENAEKSKDWEWHEEAQKLYRWAVMFKDDLLDPVLKPGVQRLPDPVISFDQMRISTLAAYTLARNPQGLLYEITMNTKQYEDEKGAKVWKYGQYAQLETLFHEQLHLKQQNGGEHPYKPGDRETHNAEFVDMAGYFGLHVKRPEGWHLQQADGLFEDYLKRHGVTKPDMPENYKEEDNLDWFKWLVDIFGGKKVKGKSTLTLWECDCGQKIRVGSKHFPGCQCNACHSQYHPNY